MNRHVAPHLSQFDGHHVDSWYAASAPQQERYPALEGVVKCDVCVAGGGFTGLSAALALAEKGLSVALLEGALIGFGASGRNGGQVLHGFASPMRLFEQQLGGRAARQCWDVSLEGVALIANRAHRHGIDCDLHWGFLTTARNKKQRQALAAWQAQLERYGYHDSQWLDQAALREHIDSPRYNAALYDAGCGHLHPLKYVQGLARAAHAAGVRMFERTAVASVDEDRRGLQIGTSNGWVRADKLVLACNVDNGGILPALRRTILPVTSHIIATEPLPEALASKLLPTGAAVCDSDHVLDYFRLSADRRLLFGGRVKHDNGNPNQLVDERRAKLARVFPQLANCRIDYAWGGHVDMGLNKLPQFGRHSSRIYYAQGFAGHGVALTGMAGQLMADAIAGDIGRFDVFARLRHRQVPVPASMEESLIRLGVMYHRVRDALGL